MRGGPYVLEGMRLSTGGTFCRACEFTSDNSRFGIQVTKEFIMGRGILLWLLGIPIPIIILILLFWR
jgi:hypothetical protein